MYSDNPAINDTVLSIINDGNGSQCGMTYAQRCEAADNGIGYYRLAVRQYSLWRTEHGSRPLLRKELFDSADLIQAYYREHIKEG